MSDDSVFFPKNKVFLVPTANQWQVIYQNLDNPAYPWGVISYTMSDNRWYGRTSDEDEDWSAWIDNNPPVVVKKSCADGHDWADTGLAKTWCKRCDITGRWVMGNVQIEETK